MRKESFCRSVKALLGGERTPFRQRNESFWNIMRYLPCNDLIVNESAACCFDMAFML